MFYINGEAMDSLQTENLTREVNTLRFALDRSAIVAITDRAGKIIHVNNKFCEISKYSREELLGQNHRIINSGHHPREFFVQMWKTISSGEVWVGEVRNRAKDGSYYWVYTTIVPFLDADGAPERYVSIRFEITERKRAEEQIVLYSKRLETSNRELQDFASVAAHDLQEPLRKILSFADRLVTRHAVGVSEEAKSFLDRIQHSAKRMQTLIDDLLTFSRVTTKAKPFAKVDLNAIVRDVLIDLEVRIEQVQGKVTVESLPVIDADASQMRQLFQNLISNALKFRRPGVPAAVSVAAKVLGNRCEISIQDNGIGFDEKYTDRIFTIFQRLHGRDEYEGNGVGLAVCRRIAERHAGTISAKSKNGSGSNFIVTLPVHQLEGKEA